MRLFVYNTAQPITGYLIEEDWCQPAGSCVVTGANRMEIHFSDDSSIVTFLQDGITSAKTFEFYLQVQNDAG